MYYINVFNKCEFTWQKYSISLLRTKLSIQSIIHHDSVTITRKSLNVYCKWSQKLSRKAFLIKSLNKQSDFKRLHIEVQPQMYEHKRKCIQKKDETKTAFISIRLSSQ